MVKRNLIIVVGGIVLAVVFLGAALFFLLQKPAPATPEQSEYKGQLTEPNATSQNLPAPLPPGSSVGNQRYQAEIVTNQNSCDIVVNNQATNKSTLVKTITKDECSFTKIQEYSLDNQYALVDAGTDVVRKFTLIHMSDAKIIAEFASYPQYLFASSELFLFVKPEVSLHDRPWGGGEGSSISSIDLKTGKEKVLFKADETHDYLVSLDEKGRIATDGYTIAVGIKIYPATGANRFDQAKVEQWLVDFTGKRINQVS